MTTETFRRADHRPVPTSAHEAEASAVALRAPSEASASCCFPLDITHSPSRRRLSKEIVGRGNPVASAHRPPQPLPPKATHSHEWRSVRKLTHSQVEAAAGSVGRSRLLLPATAATDSHLRSGIMFAALRFLGRHDI